MIKVNWLMRSLFLMCATTCFSPMLQASTIDRGDDIDQKDINALREWINTKRQVTVRELGGALSISGEVRTEYQATTEVLNGVRQRGSRGVPFGASDDSPGRRVPDNAFDVEVNLMIDYRADRSWATIKLEFDNDAGIFSGSLNKLKLEKAYWGMRLVNADTYTMDIEVGRRRISTIMDSKLEFNSFFDGVWWKYDQSFDAIGDYYLHLGAFIINENKEQFGYLGETGIFNVAGTGLYMKYSLVDWDTKEFHSKLESARFDFIVSQFLLGYRFVPGAFDKVVQAYGAVLYNHKAKPHRVTDHTRQAWGGYVGVSVGELKRQWDWAFDINYQVLEAQCVPDFDVQGIGFGNAGDTGFYTSQSNGRGTKNERRQAGGNVNYRGFQLTFDWLLTNQLDFQQSWQQSISLDKDIGPFRRFKQYEIEFIYGF